MLSFEESTTVCTYTVLTINSVLYDNAWLQDYSVPA